MLAAYLALGVIAVISIPALYSRVLVVPISAAATPPADRPDRPRDRVKAPPGTGRAPLRLPSW